jgi:hypothetical protein
MLNMSDVTRRMAIPQRLGHTWFRAVDTSRESPKDIIRPGKQQPVREPAYDVRPRTVVVLESR